MSKTPQRNRASTILAAVLLVLPTGASFSPSGPLVTPAEASSACAPTASTFVGDGTNGTDGATYRVLTFSTVGTCDWTVPAGVESVDVLVVGGGGGGGGFEWAGGGGGGGVLHGESLSVTPGGSVPIVVGAGGAGGASTDGVAGRGTNGGDSSFAGVAASGGGGGGGNGWNDANNYDGAGVSGGSGGGGGEHGDWTTHNGTTLYRITDPRRDGSGAIQYTQDSSSGFSGPIDRISYHMTIDGRYAVVSFDAWKSGLTAADLRVPDLVAPRRFVVQEVVRNLIVDSNLPPGDDATALGSSGVITSGVGATRFDGYLELWPWNYGPAGTGGTDSDGDARPTGSDVLFDINDSPGGTDTDHGSFQVHNISDGSVQTVLAWNRHRPLSSVPEIGLGNRLNDGPDWTVGSGTLFSDSAATPWELQIRVNRDRFRTLSGAESDLTAPAGWTAYGNAGGDVRVVASQAGSGGGGAGGRGGDVLPSSKQTIDGQSYPRIAGHGGPGEAFTITGTSVTYAGGGGGGTRGETGDTCSAGGTGGGGAGACPDASTPQATAGTDGLGGGGGGGHSSAGGDGGDGVVIVRYVPTALPTITIVDSGGAVAGTDWAHSNGVITATADVSIDASVISGFLDAGDLRIQAGRVRIESDADIEKNTGGDATFRIDAGSIVHQGELRSTSGALHVEFSAQVQATAARDYAIDVAGLSADPAVIDGNGGSITLTASFSSGGVAGPEPDRAIRLGAAELVTGGAGAITLTANASANPNESASAWGLQAAAAVLRTASGAIVIDATGGAKSNNSRGLAVDGGSLKVLSASGPITIVDRQPVALEGTYTGFYLRPSSTGAVVIGADEDSVPSSTSDVTLRLDKATFDGTATEVITTGAVSLEPVSPSFLSPVTNARLAFDTQVSALTLGKPGNTAGITIGSATSIAGPITIHGDSITVDAALTSTGGSSRIAFRGAVANNLNGTVTMGAAGSITADGLLIENIHNTQLPGSGTMSVGTLAARGGGRLLLTNSGALTIGTVDGVSGVTSYSDWVLLAAAGDLEVTQPVGTSAAAARLRLTAGAGTPFGTATGGDVKVSGSGAFDVPNGIAQVFSGSAANSTGLSAVAAAETVATVAPGVAVGQVAVAYRAGPPSFSSPATVRFGETLSLVVSEPSGGAVTLSKVNPGDPCTLSGTTVTPTAVGTCVVQATAASGLSAQQTITIAQAPQSIGFTSSAPSSVVAGTTYTPAASATSGLNVEFAITAGSPSVCTLSGGVVTFASSGTCTIEASIASGQAAAANYLAATPVTQTLVAGKINQSITFAQPSDRDLDAPAFAVGASVSSGRAVTYATSTPSVCTVGTSTGVVTVVDVGDCTITASSPGDASYADAPSVTRTFTVRAIAPGRTSLTSASFGAGEIAVGFTAPGSDGGAAITGYRAVATEVSDPTATVTQDCGAVSPCVIGGLTNGTAYTVTLSAVNSAGAGPASDPSPAVTPASVPEAVTGLVTTPGDEQLVVSWTQPLDLGGGTFTRYDVYRRVSGTAWPGAATTSVGSLATQTVTLTGLTNGTAYDVKVVVITSVNSTELANTNTTFALGVPVTVPDAPTGLTLTALSPTSALAAWTAPVDDGGSPITGYTLSPACTPAVPTDTSCVLTGLAGGSSVTVTVTADNLVGSSTAVSETVSLPAPPAPPSPPAPATPTPDPVTETPTGTTTTSGAGTRPTGGGSGGSTGRDDDGPGDASGVLVPTVPAPPLDRPALVPGRPFDPDGRARGVVGGLPVPIVDEATEDGGRTVVIGDASFSFLPPEVRDGVFGGGAGGGGATGGAGGATNGLLDADGRLTLAGDRGAALRGGGLLPGSSVQVFFTGSDGRAADARELVRVPVGEDGTFDGELSVARPVGEPPLPIGRHVVQIAAFDADGQPIVIEKAINIAQDAPRPELDRTTGSAPEPGAGRVAATAAGLPIELRIEVRPEVREVAAVADGWGIDVAVADGDGSAEATSGGALVSVVRSGVLTASGSGFQPGSRADVWVFSDPTLLGSVIVGDDGTFTAVVAVDAQFVAVGVHTLQVQAVGTDGFVRAVSLGIEVADGTVRAGLLGTDGGIVGMLATLPPAVLALLGAVVLAVVVLVAPTIRRRRVGGSDAA